jgi:phage terminase large subunit
MASLSAGAVGALGDWERGRTEHPLAYAGLWHNPPPLSSQRLVLMQPGEDATLAAGGNGAGKTELGAQVAAAVACGRTPAVLAWARSNGVDLSIIPPEGGTVLASSLNASLSIHVQRTAIRRYLPAATQWRNLTGPGTSVAYLPNGNKVVFVTNDAGARAMQGYSAALVWMDEEHDEAVYNEALQRVARVRWEGRSGWLLLTMTPLKGLTSWVYKRFVETPDPGTKVHYIHGGDNPFVDQVKRARILRSYGSHERAARDKGEFTAMEGLVYQFDRRVHLVDAFDPPSDWPRYGAIDFGTRNPFAYVLAAMDPADSVLHIYRLHYQTEWTHRQHAAAIRELTDVWPEWIVADSEDRGSRLTLSRDYGINTLASKKGKGSVRAGINAVAELMQLDAMGQPHLVVHDHPSTRPLVHEFQSYRWATTNTKRDQPDAPLKKDDHCMDAVRYMVRSIAASTFGVG